MKHHQLPARNAGRAWSAHSSPPRLPLSHLEGQSVTIVCIVVGGFAGRVFAQALAQRGVELVLIEVREAGYGVSARVVAEGLSGETGCWKLFAPFSFCWNGGVMGPAATETVYRPMKLIDWRRAYLARRQPTD